MSSRLLWRRSATAVGLYASAAVGILGTIIAARLLGLRDFGLFATVAAAVGFFQALLDLTVEESLTKYGFRYVAAGDWGRLRRLFRRALELKLAGGVLAALALLALAPAADAIFGADGLLWAMVAAALLPAVQAPENVASTALLLRGRYDVRALLLTFSMTLRLVAIALGARHGVAETFLALATAQALATAVTGVAGLRAFRRFPAVPPTALGADRRGVVAFVLRSSAATGILSLRAALAPLLLGIVAGPTQVGLFRVALAPQSGFATLSSPARLILLTEQTRDWERGLRPVVVRGVLRYSAGAAVLVAVALAPLLWLMPELIRLVFGAEFLGATNAARIILVAASLQLVYGWTKSLPVSIGRPGLRIATHGVESLVMLPLVAVLGAYWGVTGAAAGVLASTVVFVLLWTVLFRRLREEVAAAGPGLDPREALAR
jgi:O-antigen/teichoic acid export membrane protein